MQLSALTRGVNADEAHLNPCRPFTMMTEQVFISPSIHSYHMMLLLIWAQEKSLPPSLVPETFSYGICIGRLYVKSLCCTDTADPSGRLGLGKGFARGQDSRAPQNIEIDLQALASGSFWIPLKVTGDLRDTGRGEWMHSGLCLISAKTFKHKTLYQNLSGSLHLPFGDQ